MLVVAVPREHARGAVLRLLLLYMRAVRLLLRPAEATR